MIHYPIFFVGENKYQVPWFPLLSISIVILAAFLRLLHIDEQPLWLDEAFSYFIIKADHWPQTLQQEANPPLYFVLLRGWSWLAGDSAYALRALSAVFGTLFVGSAIWTGRIVFNRETALYAGAFSSIAPIHIYYSQEARAYVMLATFLMLSYGFLAQAVRSQKVRWWVLFSAGSLCALYTHYFAFLALAPSVLLTLNGRALRVNIQRYFLAMAASIVGLLPWVVLYVMANHGIGSAHDWIGHVWTKTPPLLAIFKSIEILSIGGEADLVPIFLKQFNDLHYPSAMRIVGMVMVYSVLASFVLAVCRDNHRSFGEKAHEIWVIVAAITPLLVLWALSWFEPYYVVGRYDFIVFPAFALFIGAGSAKLRRLPKFGRLASPVLLLLLASALVVKLYYYYTSHDVPYGPSSKAVADALASGVGHRDTVMFTGVGMLPVLYELRRHNIQWRGSDCVDKENGRQFLCLALPYDHSDVSFLAGILSDNQVATTEVDDQLNAVFAKHQEAENIWLVVGIPRNEQAAGRTRDLIQGLNARGYYPDEDGWDLRALKIQRFRAR